MDVESDEDNSDEDSYYGMSRSDIVELQKNQIHTVGSFRRFRRGETLLEERTGASEGLFTDRDRMALAMQSSSILNMLSC